MQRDKETGHVSEEPVRLIYREATKNKKKNQLPHLQKKPLSFYVLYIQFYFDKLELHL